MLKKNIWANFQRIIELFTKKIVTKLSKIWVWDPRSGKNLFRIPDPGVKKAPDPGSGSATLIFPTVGQEIPYHQWECTVRLRRWPSGSIPPAGTPACRPPLPGSGMRPHPCCTIELDAFKWHRKFTSVVDPDPGRRQSCSVVDPHWFHCGSGSREPKQSRSLRIRILVRL